MICPNCSSLRSQVSNSRRFTRKQQVWRRRECATCGFSFTTREQLDLEYLSVAKKDGSSEPFIPAKLLVSVVRACDHLPDYQRDAQALAETVTTKLLPAPEGKLTSANIARTAMDVLKRFNAGAFVKYAAYQTDLIDKRQVRRQLSS